MASMRELKGRIGSVSSSQKITGAMKMISSAKMRKAELALRKVRPFRNQIQTTISHLLEADGEYTSPLTEQRAVKRIALVLLGSDEGLCGAFNVSLCKLLLETIRNARAEAPVSFVIYPVGKKAVKFASKLACADIEVVQLPYMSAKSSAEEVKQFTAVLTESFLNREVDRVEVVYMNFKSMSRQELATRVVLPIEAGNFPGASEGKYNSNKPYLFEPDANTIYNKILPLFVLSDMQELVCENRASEQAARVMAMQTANDNATKLLEELQLEYNKLRQQSITTELLDILGGKVEG